MSDPPTSLSLLQRARDSGDAQSWRALTDLYTPLIRKWVRANAVQSADVDDIVQEVLATLVRELPRFQHNDRPGAFRAWLRTVAVNRLREHWKSRRSELQGAGGAVVMEHLNQLEDPDSLLSRAWDDEHDRHVARTLLESIRLEFQAASWFAFEQTVQEGRPAAEVAAELGTTANAVLIAKSRILKRLRGLAGDLFE